MMSNRVNILTLRLRWLVLGGAVLICFSLPLPIHAQVTDSFIIETLVGNDTATPTVPGNFSVVPVTSSQIDLDWDASSDNVSVSGYQIFRDAAQIATTSLTSYSDTGLSASTTYAYYIRAFDTSFNYSSSTATLATTTLALTPTTTPTTTPAGSETTSGFRRVLLDSLQSSVTERTVRISLETNTYTRVQFRWGRTVDYEAGFIATDIFKRSHATEISGLTPGTVYEIEVTIFDRSGRQSITKTLTVTTAVGQDTAPPPNVVRLQAQQTDAGVLLSWQNPAVSDFSHVRVLGSDRFYPVHSADGWLVYQGSDDRILDDRVLQDNARRYYTVFAYDMSGNVSSGAIAAVSSFERGGGVTAAQPADLRDSLSEVVPTTATSTASEDGEILLSFSDVEFWQAGDLRKPQAGVVTLFRGYETEVRLLYEALPEHLKTITFTLGHDDLPSSVSMLLRINADKTAYTGQFIADLEPGAVPATVTVFDYSTRELYEVHGMVNILPQSEVVSEVFEISVWQNSVYRMYAGVLIVICGLWWLLFFWRRRREDEDSVL